jgi:hypothetical protein
MLNHLEKRNGFRDAAKPLIEWLNQNCHPHTKVIVDQTQAELVEGQISFVTHDYLRDKEDGSAG